MNARQRWYIWLALLLALLVAAIYPLEDTGVKATPAAPVRAASRSAKLPMQVVHRAVGHSVLPNTWISDEMNDALPALAADPFAVVDWDRAPAPPPSAQVERPVFYGPDQPVEPGFPYKFVGRMVEEDGKATYYLSNGPETIAAHVGDLLSADYRILSATDAKLKIEYRPMAKIHEISLENP
jgi:hypothetical protein